MRPYLFFLLFVFLFACSDKITQKEEDILKYGYLQPFILEGQQFLGGKLDMDNNNLEYSYKVLNGNKEMEKVKNKAFLEGWKLKSNIFIKYIEIYDGGGETISVSVIKSDDKIIFKVHSE